MPRPAVPAKSKARSIPHGHRARSAVDSHRLAIAAVPYSIGQPAARRSSPAARTYGRDRSIGARQVTGKAEAEHREEYMNAAKKARLPRRPDHWGDPRDVPRPEDQSLMVPRTSIMPPGRLVPSDAVGETPTRLPEGERMSYAFGTDAAAMPDLGDEESHRGRGPFGDDAALPSRRQRLAARPNRRDTQPSIPGLHRPSAARPRQPGAEAAIPQNARSGSGAIP